MSHPTCNEKAIQIFMQLSPYFQGLGDPVRQQIVALLIDKESLNVSQIAEHIPMSRPTVSHHLKILRQAGLLQAKKKGTEIYYRLEIAEAISLFKQLVQFVEEEC
ncbi:transcriptional regulator [Brevibacillus agri]|uniref:Transcriptional regulator n=1 Tax=Brevibacillus agri TaxID=51101 RepID=A0A3M8AYQ4_9BACL|nr:MULTISPECIES: metalloregulator ArsR/SmtB family transcription factor [Brevibacillus]EJL42464.1 putative transcriptional regulator [Brevibacillus sp. CF112]MBG9564984.1 ArsR family transcriptional regulator [Brevibacillus agri]MBY0051213.1 winged helix-turn-helix transcriptional regulator [Brevibacillus agri]MCG5250392.1 metalloregulator ArsR/SmtB family transcription factor [Brevibacillus agri]MDN4093145.1 metalloregulator ArsR/SmtB family transcription factor [Brevibacillus agri]